MPKIYFAIFIILLAIPVIGAVAAVAYFSFKISMLAGFIALGICIVAIAIVAIVIINKIKSIRGSK